MIWLGLDSQFDAIALHGVLRSTCYNPSCRNPLSRSAYRAERLSIGKALSMADPAIVTVVQSYLAAVERAGIPVAFGVIFGSWAKGTADAWSDIDVVVVSPRFDGPRDRVDTALLWRQAARVDSRIEPIACGVDQWSSDDSSAIVEIARRSGQRVALPQAA